MSLISDGLKKAHLDALRQDREQRRQFLSPGRMDVPSGGSNAVAIGTAAFASAIVAAVVAVYFVRSAQPAAVPVVVAATRPAPAVTPAQPPAVAPATAPSSVAKPRPLPAARSGAIASVKGTTTSLVSLESSPVRDRERVRKPVERDAAPAPVAESRPAPVAAAVAPPAAEAPRRIARRDRFVDGETYASPISAPGGIEVTLSGISSARGESVAIMNGNVIRVGSTVGPFTVEKIERGRVQLKYIDVRIWMTY